MQRIFEHDTSLIEKFRRGTLALSGRDIKIQEGRWLTLNFNVIGSCVKGRNFAILACSVVTKNALPNFINGKIPAKEI
jgi:acetyltransferase-like isoleucine patch superfamily enzyme